MKTLILPEENNNEEFIDISEITSDDLIIVYNDNELIGFCVYNEYQNIWYIQNGCDIDNIDHESSSFYDLVKELQKAYNNLKILVK